MTSPDGSAGHIHRSADPPATPSRDPLYVQLTRASAGAIAVFVLDGDGVLARLRGVFRSKRRLGPQVVTLGQVIDASGALVDEAVATCLPPRESETGLEQIELSCHGGAGVSAAVGRVLEAAGFRPARPRELAARAHRAVRLSLPALEARLRLPTARTPRQADIILSHKVLQERWERLGLEVALALRHRTAGWREMLRAATDAALRQAVPAGRLLRTHRILLAGPVNAGKSTLINRLLRAEKSLVSALPGTTRDLLARPAALQGLSVVLCDSAGLQDQAAGSEAVPDDAEIAQAGQARVWAESHRAALLLLVVDGSRAPTESECDLAARLVASAPPAEAADNAPPRALLVLNKSDLGLHPEAEALGFALNIPVRAVAAREGVGLAELEADLERALLGAEAPVGGAPFTQRQAQHLRALRAALQEELDGEQLIGHIRALVGTRPNETELAAVFAEAGEAGG